MNPATTPLFTPNPSAGQPKPKIVRGNADERYNEALDYLRLELKVSFFKPIASAEFSNTFKISHSFLAVLCAIGVVEKRTKKKVSYYKATERLWEVDATKILKEKRILYPNKPYSRPLVLPSLANAAIVNSEPYGPGAVIPVKAETAQPTTETYLIGIANLDNITIALNSKIKTDSPEEAIDFMQSYNCAAGAKIVLLKVVEVLEAKQVLQPTTL